MVNKKYFKISKINGDNKEYFLVFIFAFVLFLTALLTVEIKQVDEIWCYGFSKRIAEGLVPYRDFNMVITPLFCYIGAFFSDTLKLFRLYGALISSGTVLMVYYISRKYSIDKTIAYIITFLSLILLSSSSEANYNTLLVFFFMVSYSLCEDFRMIKSSKNAFLIGISLSIAFLVKQNIPTILIALMSLFMLILFIKKRITIRNLFMYIIGVAFPILIWLGYLIYTDSLISFIDYAFLGLSSFSNMKVVYDSAVLLALIFLPMSIYLIIGIIKKSIDSEFGILILIFNLSSYFMIYPLSDIHHTKWFLIMNFMLLIPLVKNLRFNLSALQRPLIICLGIVALLPILTNILNVKNDYKLCDIKPYQGLFIKKELENNISIVSNYIREEENNGNDVAVIDIDAYSYCLPANDNNGVLDLLNFGNIGSKSLDDIIYLIDKKDIILIAPENPYLVVEGVKEYIMKSYVKEKQVGNMYVMKKKGL